MHPSAWCHDTPCLPLGVSSLLDSCISEHVESKMIQHEVPWCHLPKVGIDPAWTGEQISPFLSAKNVTPCIDFNVPCSIVNYLQESLSGRVCNSLSVSGDLKGFSQVQSWLCSRMAAAGLLFPSVRLFLNCRAPASLVCRIWRWLRITPVTLIFTTWTSRC